MRMRWGWLGLLSVGLVVLSCARSAAPDGTLTFKRNERVVAEAPLTQLLSHVEPREVATYDPYYQQQKRFRALPMAALLAHVFKEDRASLRKHSYVLKASDGYFVTVAGSQLLDDDAFLAIDDLDVPGFAPIGPRKVSPAPSYLVWRGDQHTDLETHPRPWQLTNIEIADLSALYPHVTPQGEPEGSSAMRGYQLFLQRCIRCHAINREGGRVGPELNVPQSIVAYRPEPQIRAYIKDPRTFRYGAMPANPDLTDADLDSLLAYFRAMSSRPYDPEAKSTHD